MKVGCVTEIKKYEYRVGMTPDNVVAYIAHGHAVYVQKGAGLGSGFPDEEYVASGATMLDTAAEVWAECDMIIKVKEPLEAEYSLMRENQIIYTYLHLAADRSLTDAMLKAKVKGVAYETITDPNGGLPLLKPMSEIAGRLAVTEGAYHLKKTAGGIGLLMAGVPGVPKANVVILGGGNVGTNACKMAVGLGADVTIIDLNLDRLTYLDDMFGARIQTVYSTEAAIEKALSQADLVIGAVLIPGAKAPKLVKQKHLSIMRPNSVIVDVAVDQGGCCETTKATYHDEPTFVLENVVHYCVANMPGAVPRTSTIALTNATLRFGLCIADNGVEEASKRIPGIVPGINTYDGKLTFKSVADAFDLEYTDIKALI